MLKKTIVPLLASILMLSLTASPLAAAPSGGAEHPLRGRAASLVSAIQDLWLWTVAGVSSPDDSEAAESLQEDAEDDAPIASGFPGYEPAGEDMQSSSSEEDGTPSVWPDIEPVG